MASASVRTVVDDSGGIVDDREFARWRRSAAEALAGARAQQAAGLPHWACFLAEQAAQLAMKALLHGVGAGAWEHDQVELGSTLEAQFATPLPADVAAALRRLSRHYIATRYPDAHPAATPGVHYGEEDGNTAIADAERLTSFVDAEWAQLAPGPP